MVSPTMEACAYVYDRDSTTPPLYPRNHCSGTHNHAPFQHDDVHQNKSLQSPTRTPSPQPQQSQPTLFESPLWDPTSPILLESPLSDSSNVSLDSHLTTCLRSQVSPQPPTPPPSPQTPVPSPLKMSTQPLLSSPQSHLPPTLRTPIPKPHNIRQFLVDSSPLVPHLPRLSPQSPSPQSSRTHLLTPATLKNSTSISQTPRHFPKDSSPVGLNSLSSYHSQKSLQSPPSTPPPSPQTPQQSSVTFLPPKPQSPWRFLQGLSPVLQSTTPSYSPQGSTHPLPLTTQPLITQSSLPLLHTPTSTSQTPQNFLQVSFTQLQQNTHSPFPPPQQSKNQNNNSEASIELDIGGIQHLPKGSLSNPIYIKSKRFNDDIHQIHRQDSHQGNPLPTQQRQRWSQSSNFFTHYFPFSLLNSAVHHFQNQRGQSSSASDNRSQVPRKPILTTEHSPDWQWKSVTFKDPLSYTVLYKGMRKKADCTEEEEEKPVPPSNKGLVVCSTIVLHYITCLGIIMLALYNDKFYNTLNQSVWQGIAVGATITLVSTLFIYTFLHPTRHLAMVGTITLNVLITVVSVYTIYHLPIHREPSHRARWRHQER